MINLACNDCQDIKDDLPHMFMVHGQHPNVRIAVNSFNSNYCSFTLTVQLVQQTKQCNVGKVLLLCVEWYTLRCHDYGFHP